MADSGSWSCVVDRLRAVTEGEFIIGGELGRGGMAAVFLAYDVKLNRRVAIKVMSPALLMGEGLVQRFMDEAVMMANLRHPNIITVHAVREVDDLHFFVMQFVNGRALDQVIEHAGTIDIAAVRAILWQVGSALSYAHRHGVIHRDVKPANILIDADGNALVTDFGIAKAVESSKQTQTGVLVGTPLYMSPEQCYGQPVSAMSDQYSLGIVAYELLTHSTPFSGSGFKIMQAHTGEAPPPPRSIRPDIPEGVERAILRMLAKEPHERWPSIRDALSALGSGPVDEGDPVRATLARFATLGDGPAAARDPITPAGRVFASGAGASGMAAAASLPPEPHQLFLIVADPPNSVEVGDEVTMTAVVCREKGTIVANSRITWSTSDYRIASIDRTSGRLKALAAGVVSITASADGLTDVVQLSVKKAGVSGVELTIPRGKIRVGDRVKLSATPRDKHSTPIPAQVTWSTTNVDVATVSADGELHAVAAGDVEISAEAAGVRGEARVVVLSRKSVPAVVQPNHERRGIPPLVRRLAFGGVAAAAAVVLVAVLVRNWQSGTPPGRRDSVVTDTASGIIDSVKIAGGDSLTKVPGKLVIDSAKPKIKVSTISTTKDSARPKVIAERVKRDTAVAHPPGGEDTTTKIIPTGVETHAQIESLPPKAESTRVHTPARLTDAELGAARAACIAVLRNKDVAALPVMYRSASAADRQNEATLKRLMEDGSAKLVIDAPTLGAATIDEAGRGAAEFTVPMRWRNSFGRNRETAATFRAEATKDPDGWHGTGCRIVGTPRLQ
jgi:hypothetical protein